MVTEMLAGSYNVRMQISTTYTLVISKNLKSHLLYVIGSFIISL
jgi:hypothetical protein